jgi:hypothetical protein
MVSSTAVTTPSTPPSRGLERLLWDCETVGEMAEPDHAPARERLTADLGEDLARVLLLTLRESEPSTPHEEQLWRAAQDVA